MSEVQGRHDEIQGEILHEYDGIEEADNQLPLWWVAGFIFTIGFGVMYWFAYEVFAAEPTPLQEYAMATQAIEEARAERAKNAPPATAEQLDAMAKDPAVLAAGGATYAANCVACHGDKGQGTIGPNLTDRYWLHGASPMEIHQTVADGVPAKGMPPWGPVLGPGAVQEVVAYVLTLRNTEVQGKAPEGEEVAAQQ